MLNELFNLNSKWNDQFENLSIDITWKYAQIVMLPKNEEKDLTKETFDWIYVTHCLISEKKNSKI